LGYGRGGTVAALQQVSPSARALVIGISSDILFPTYFQRETVEQLNVIGRHAEYSEISSPWGHDAFLIEHAQLTEAITRFLEAQESVHTRTWREHAYSS
jgi:homoserine O-acetyltransferase